RERKPGRRRNGDRALAWSSYCEIPETDSIFIKYQ
ncbi:hypothetical protein LEP1GSC008_3305, partial [Leptospira kirschneri serovar Bulgarica str. Nikolaevo]